MTAPDDMSARTADRPAPAARGTGRPGFAGAATEADMERMLKNASDAATFLKAIGHEGRMMILCHLSGGEKSVTELETLLAARQAAVSQQLARLRLEGLVTPRRDGKTIYYSLTDDRTTRIMEVLYDLFCGADSPDR